jgi:isocitrate dehydrogenase
LKITYTLTDEAPALATRSFLPIIRAFGAAAGVTIESRDISLVGRMLAQFPERLTEEQRIGDALAELGELVGRSEANIIKLPNISASLPQLKAAIAEVQGKGYDLPDYPDEPSSDEEREIQARYKKVTGSAVNPVLRQGNSDRRAPASVKNYARKHPHRLSAWSPDSTTHVATMDAGDFRSNERSVTVESATEVTIQHVADDGAVTVLRPPVALQDGEILDATVMSRAQLCDFLAAQLDDARDRGVLFSLHLKATMMKVSDPIIFGHAVRTFFADVFARYGDTLERIGANPNNGLASVLSALQKLPEAERAPIEAAIQATFEQRPALAMVDSDRGITNLHVPSDVIIDASMPPMIRDSGKMWNPAGELADTKAVIPDHSYAPLYQAVIDFCREHGALDPATMGTVPNVGLMAQAAEEYGSHDKTFEIAGPGRVQVVDSAGTVLLEHTVDTGDIWRACQTKDAPVRDWVKLAVTRARASGAPAVFWLDRDRAHDAELLKKVDRYLSEHDTNGLQIEVLAPGDAARLSVERIAKGDDTISVTGNVLRDYLTDLFPILELGTSAKMLSIVPLLAGGGLFETGAGGSAPKHVQQFVKENHLRWDSLGEFLALAASFELLATSTGNPSAQILADTLDQATGELLDTGKSPSRKCGELDNRGSQFYLALYWAQALAQQTDDPGLAARFKPLAERLAADETTIVEELNAVQGQPVDLGGYYLPDPDLASAAMRPSATFNAALIDLG